MADLKPGDKVNYVPHHDHWHDDGGAHFRWVHVEDGPPPTLAQQAEGITRAKKGEAVKGRFAVAADSHAELGRVESFENGVVRTSKGYAIKVEGPRSFWPAVVREDVAVATGDTITLPDGKEAVMLERTRRLVLDVKPPGSVVTLHLPLDGAGAVARDPTGATPHSCHPAEGSA